MSRVLADRERRNVILLVDGAKRHQSQDIEHVSILSGQHTTVDDNAEQCKMPLTRHFKEKVQARVVRDPEFRRGLYQEAVDAFLDNDMVTGKVLLRDYINATVGFRRLGEALQKSPKSLMRMLSTQGNPRADNLFSVLAYLKSQAGMTCHLTSEVRR